MVHEIRPYSECSKDPFNCPENEGFGCCIKHRIDYLKLHLARELVNGIRPHMKEEEKQDSIQYFYKKIMEHTKNERGD